MATSRRNCFECCSAVIATIVAVGIVWVVVQLVFIQLRLWRNWPISQTLAQSLDDSFPGVKCHGNAAYNQEVIYIGIPGKIKEEMRCEIEHWLRTRKREMNLSTRILLRFWDDD